MHIHILGICGTFMGGLALIARTQGHHVTGSDAEVYPPMSTQLKSQGIRLMKGYLPEHLKPAPDVVVVGNALSRGNPAVEYLLDERLPYVSGPQWLADNVLQDRWVLAVAGTHGKTTTSGLLAWILEDAGLEPGFLIGGIPQNFGVSARLGIAPFFVIEADEYDSAFFDKRSKFIHYRPRTLVLNNLEYDHADIFPDLAAIKQQFHHLVRTVPGNGRIIVNASDPELAKVLAMGCWTPRETYSAGEADADWRVNHVNNTASKFEVLFNNQSKGAAHSGLIGRHNLENTLAAFAAAQHVGVMPASAIESLGAFRPVQRRMEVVGQQHGVTVYDDFAHHPTEIRETLSALRAHVDSAPIIAVVEPRSNTMRMGVHKKGLVRALKAADLVFIYHSPELSWDPRAVFADSTVPTHIGRDIDALAKSIASEAHDGAHILVMSNGAFGGIHEKILENL